MHKISKDSFIQEVKINSDRAYDSEINDALTKMFDENSVNIKSQMNTENTLLPMIKGLQLGGNCFSFILILIGLLNFVNVLITGVETRKKELAIMQAIGMTNKQLYKTLLYETFYYIGISILFISSIGMFITKALLNTIHNTLYYFVYVYPLNSLLFLIFFLITLCTITTILLYKSITKDSICKNINMNTE